MFPRDLKGTSLVCCRCALLVTLDLLRDGIYLLFRAAQRRKYDAVEAIPQQCHALALSSHRISLVTIKGYCPKALLCCSARKQQQQPLLLFKLLLGGFWKGIEQDGEEMFVMVYVVKQQSYSFPPFLWGSRICNTVVVKRHNTDC